MPRITRFQVALLTCCIWFAATRNMHAAPKTSADNVKFTVKTAKAEGGKQIVTLTMEIAQGWHAYANPVGNNDFTSVQTEVTFTSGGKPVPAKVTYPEGKLVKDKDIGDFRTYEGTITITAVLDRAGNDPVEATVVVQTCTETMCLTTSKMKLKID